LSWQDVLEAECGDAFHLTARRDEFGFGCVGNAGLEGREDASLGVVADCNDEREAVF
jgi:hypothetical protein